MLKIAVDLDNTILDVPSTIINLHNKLNENKLKYNKGDMIGWKFEPLIKTDEELAELFKLFDHPRFYDKAITYKNAIKVINELSMQNDICIISKHMESRKNLTRKWIYENFPSIKLIFVDDFRDKGQVLKNFGADIIIDDRIDALESCEGIVPYRICFGNYQWNEQYNGLRATDWSELYKMIRNIKDTIENNKLTEQNKEMEGIKRWEF
jgi:5'(3')-deoxyribonucleotidase